MKHLSGAPLQGKLLAPTHKYSIRLARLFMNKHSSLFLKSVNYAHKKFYSTGPRLYCRPLANPGAERLLIQNSTVYLRKVICCRPIIWQKILFDKIKCQQCHKKQTGWQGKQPARQAGWQGSQAKMARSTCFNCQYFYGSHQHNQHLQQDRLYVPSVMLFLMQ